FGDPAPGEVLPDTAGEVVDALVVRGERDDGVAFLPWTVAAVADQLVHEFVCGRFAAAAGVGEPRVQDREPHAVVFGDVGRGFGGDDHTGEVSCSAAFGVESCDDFGPHVFFVEAFGVVAGHAAQRLLQVEPVGVAVGVEVG